MNNKIDTPWKHTSRGNWREDRTETIKQAERKLVYTLCFTLGFIWLLLVSFGLETQWYSFGVMIAFLASLVTGIIRFIGELKKGDI